MQSTDKLIHTDSFIYEKTMPNPLYCSQEHFSNPKSLADYLHRTGFKAIWMLDPGIKHENGYSIYESGSEKDIWVQTADGKPYIGTYIAFNIQLFNKSTLINCFSVFIGEVWPGPCVFPDFTQEKARSWWANLVKDFISNGVDGIWNDMNEPAIFKVIFRSFLKHMGIWASWCTPRLIPWGLESFWFIISLDFCFSFTSR